jgi:hypothetical protein
MVRQGLLQTALYAARWCAIDQASACSSPNWHPQLKLLVQQDFTGLQIALSVRQPSAGTERSSASRGWILGMWGREELIQHLPSLSKVAANIPVRSEGSANCQRRFNVAPRRIHPQAQVDLRPRPASLLVTAS